VREEVSCKKYNKIWMIVDIEDKFRVGEAEKIIKYCKIELKRREYSF
jgi:hypothetical protein